MSAEANHSAQQASRSETVTQTQCTALTEATDENSFANFFVRASDSSMSPKLYLFGDFLIDDGKTFLDLVEIESIGGIGIGREVIDIVPTGGDAAKIDGDFAQGGIE